MKRLLMLVVVLLLICSSALSHSGGADSNGGHTNHSTGEYHYHHGYPAHDHDGGVCPYDFKDNTRSKSSKKSEPDNGGGITPGSALALAAAAGAGGVYWLKGRK